MTWSIRTVLEQHPDGSFTVTYSDGPKAGLDVHFFSETELNSLFDDWVKVLPLRADRLV